MIRIFGWGWWSEFGKTEKGIRQVSDYHIKTLFTNNKYMIKKESFFKWTSKTLQDDSQITLSVCIRFLLTVVWTTLSFILNARVFFLNVAMTTFYSWLSNADLKPQFILEIQTARRKFGLKLDAAPKYCWWCSWLKQCNGRIWNHGV